MDRREGNKVCCVESNAKKVSQEGSLCHLSHLLIDCQG